MTFNIPPAPAPPYPPAGVSPTGMPPGWPPQPGVPSVPPPTKPGYTQDIGRLALLILVIAAHVAINTYWLHADNHLVHLDEAHHISRSVAFHQALFPEGGERLLTRALALLGLESPYPPLSHLVGAVFIRVLGYSPDTVALSGSFALALLLLGVYALARLGMTARNAFLVALVTSLIPMVYGYSRLVMPDTLCGALIVWALFGLAKSGFCRKTGWSAFFGIMCGLAFLTGGTVVVYLALPFLLALLWGVANAVRSPPRESEAPRGRRNFDILLHAALGLFIIVAVCSWWYLRHLEYLYTWWTTQRGLGSGLFQPAIASRLSQILPAITETPEARIALDPSIAHVAEASREAGNTYPFTAFLEPYRLYWSRYLVYLVNEVAFIPLALVALLGVLALPLKRNRTVLAPLLLAWVLGGYALLTGLFALHSPRFLHGMAPALAFFAVLTLDAVPQVRLRRVLWALFLGVLILQFINVSLLPFGPLKRAEIPVLADHADSIQRGNRGLTLYKDVIQTGNYVIHAPQTGGRIIEAALEAMAEFENRRQAPAGAAAWFQVVSPIRGALGVDFYARQYGPSPNPSRPVFLNEAAETTRPFVAVKSRSILPEDTLPELAETEYIILQQPFVGDYISVLEGSTSFFADHGFESIFHDSFSGYGPAVPCYVHVMARREFPPVTEISNLFDAYDMLDQDGKSYLLPDGDRNELERQYALEVSRYNELRPLSNRVNLMGFHVKATTQDWFQVRLVVHATAPLDKDMRVWLRVRCHEEDRDNLFVEQQQQSQLVWDFYPEPPSTQWKRNEALVLTRPVMARPLRYQVDIGLYDPETEERPSVIIETEWVDFSKAE